MRVPQAKPLSLLGLFPKIKFLQYPETPDTGRSRHSCSVAFHLLAASSQPTAGALVAEW